MLSRFGAVFDVTDPAAVRNGMPAAEAPSTVSSSAVAEPGIEVMMPHLLSMQARIWAICRAGMRASRVAGNCLGRSRARAEQGRISRD